MKVFNTALLSFGMSGYVFHAPFIDKHPGFNLLGSWERSAKKIQDSYVGVHSYESLEAVLEDDNVELVIVNTPTYTHFEYAKKALEAGKHVVVEKAFTSNAAEAIELKALADKKGLQIAVFQNRRWDSDFLTIKSIVESGELGDVIEATFGYLRFAPELSPKTHKEEPSGGAGIVKDLGPHVIDQALHLFGLPQSVFADIGITRPGSQVDDYFDILLSYPDKRVHVKAGYYFKAPGPYYSIYGTHGSFLKARGDVQEDQLKQDIKPNDPSYGVEPAILHGNLHLADEVRSVISERGNYLQFYKGVHQALTLGVPMPVTAAEGINVMRIIDAAFESHDAGRRVTL
jgi:predicted dehydrogenase